MVYVIDILPATSCVFAYGLKHSASRFINGNRTPGRRKAKCIDSSEISPSYFVAVGGNISEAALSPDSPDPCFLKSFDMSHKTNRWFVGISKSCCRIDRLMKRLECQRIENLASSDSTS